MTVQYIFVNNKKVSISGTGYTTDGEFSEDYKNFERILEI
jgi:hypothetical protein